MSFSNESLSPGPNFFYYDLAYFLNYLIDYSNSAVKAEKIVSYPFYSVSAYSLVCLM